MFSRVLTLLSSSDRNRPGLPVAITLPGNQLSFSVSHPHHAFHLRTVGPSTASSRLGKMVPCAELPSERGGLHFITVQDTLAVDCDASVTFAFTANLAKALFCLFKRGFRGGPSGEEPSCQFRSCKRCGCDSWAWEVPGGGHGNLLQHSCLENPTDRGAWRAIVHGVAKSQA